MAVQAAQEMLVQHDQADEHGDGNGGPEDGEALLRQRHPDDDHGRDYGCQTEVAEKAVALFPHRDGTAALVQELEVSGTWVFRHLPSPLWHGMAHASCFYLIQDVR